MKKNLWFLTVVIGLVMMCITIVSCKKTIVQNYEYCDVAPYGDVFIATGYGRLDVISADGLKTLLPDGRKVSFSDISVENDIAVAVGTDRKVAIVNNGDLLLYDNDSPLYCVCSFGGEWLAGSEHGKILKTTDFENWKIQRLPTKDKIIGIAAHDDFCVAVTDRGELIASNGNDEWTVTDYEQSYGKQISLYGIEAFDNMFWAYGAYDNGDAAIIMSQEGGVWSERDLTVRDKDSTITASEMRITGICSDGEQKAAVLSDGRVLILPGCVECNKIDYSAGFPAEAIACNGETVLVAGENYKYIEESINAIRQDRIKSDAAYLMQQSGAYIIDVRSLEEYEKRHIADSIQMDSELVANQLPDVCPDKMHEIIFYCESGVRSEKAVNTAKSMGYRNVYNLGGIDDWSYDFVP